jgi:hypothetical protein
MTATVVVVDKSALFGTASVLPWLTMPLPQPEPQLPVLDQANQQRLLMLLAEELGHPYTPADWAAVAARWRARR